ncbi:hypothetical protein MRX96_058732 [Rhipicephalus microplus]
MEEPPYGTHSRVKYERNRVVGTRKRLEPREVRKEPRGQKPSTPAKRNGADSSTISASFDVLAGDHRTSTAKRVGRGAVCEADAKVGTAARMIAAFGRVSVGTSGKRNSVNAPTKSAYFEVPARDRRTSTVNRVSRGVVRDANEKVGSATRIFAVFAGVSGGPPARPRSIDSCTNSAPFDVFAGDRRSSRANRVCRGGLRDADAKVGNAARMFAVFGRVSAGTPWKPNGADYGTISASFDVPAGDRRTSTVNRVSPRGVRDADAKVENAARIFALFGGVSGGTPEKPRSANSRTISASFDALAGDRRTSTAKRVCRGEVCDADEKVGSAARIFAAFAGMSGGTPVKPRSAN